MQGEPYFTRTATLPSLCHQQGEGLSCMKHKIQHMQHDSKSQGDWLKTSTLHVHPLPLQKGYRTETLPRLVVKDDAKWHLYKAWSSNPRTLPLGREVIEDLLWRQQIMTEVHNVRSSLKLYMEQGTIYLAKVKITMFNSSKTMWNWTELKKSCQLGAGYCACKLMCV